MAADPHEQNNLQVFVAGAGVSLFSVISFQLTGQETVKRISRHVAAGGRHWFDEEGRHDPSHTLHPVVCRRSADSQRVDQVLLRRHQSRYGLKLWSFTVTVVHIVVNYLKTALPVSWNVLKVTLRLAWIISTTVPVLFFDFEHGESRASLTEEDTLPVDNQFNIPAWIVAEIRFDFPVVPRETALDAAVNTHQTSLETVIDATSQEETPAADGTTAPKEQPAAKTHAWLPQESPFFSKMIAPILASCSTPPAPETRPVFTLSPRPTPLFNSLEAPVEPKKNPPPAPTVQEVYHSDNDDDESNNDDGSSDGIYQLHVGTSSRDIVDVKTLVVTSGRP
ncbi:hypothetical protein LTR92_010971 [Exophiala xenobiotica]|nr:hypothetical protein LTR92_010971 [Exophiala xenobiotica]